MTKVITCWTWPSLYLLPRLETAQTNLFALWSQLLWPLCLEFYVCLLFQTWKFNSCHLNSFHSLVGSFPFNLQKLVAQWLLTAFTPPVFFTWLIFLGDWYYWYAILIELLFRQSSFIHWNPFLVIVRIQIFMPQQFYFWFLCTPLSDVIKVIGSYIRMGVSFEVIEIRTWKIFTSQGNPILLPTSFL